MTRSILLKLADDVTDTVCGSCDYASYLPYADPMIYVCTRPEFATRVDGGYETAIRVSGERVAACISAEQQAARCVEIEPDLVRRAAIDCIVPNTIAADAQEAASELEAALREHGRKANG